MTTPPSVSASCGALLLLAFCFFVPDEVQAQNRTALRSFNTFRLPNSTVPTHYTLRLDTDIHKGIFVYSGKLLIRIKIVEATDQIVLHSLRSVITCLEIRNSDRNLIPIKGFTFDVEKEFLIINVGQVLQPHSGSFTLDITFTNSIDRNDRAGFYRSSYKTKNGTTRYLGLTQFESIDARTAFPCYDEPGIKATFDIVILCGKDYHVRSNTPRAGLMTFPNDKKAWYFARTPRMQTYLVAWLVSDFVSVEAVLPQPKLTIATWSDPSLAHLLSYSINVSTRFIRVMEEYFGERYSLPKLDNVVISSFDFVAAAMENWGLVTFRQAYITYDPLRNGLSTQLLITKTIAHEYVHQFFGNLLAPKWWNYLWLNEGFAGFYQYYVGSISHPEVIQRELFVTHAMQTAFNADSLATVPPMTHYVESRQNITRLFGPVVYDKAASVLRMMSYALGERTFQKGLRYYLQKNKARGVVEESDLFESLEQAAKEDEVLSPNLSMHKIFRSWSNQAGVPIVSVRRDGDEFYFTQTRYFAKPQEDPLDSSWWIPISFSTPSNTAFEKLPAFWMPPHVSEVSYTIPLSEGEIVTFNPHATGYYRISYEQTMLNELIQRLSTDHGSLQPAARARLIDDTLNVAHRDGGDYHVALKLMSYLREETDYVPWMVAYENLRYLKTMLRGDEKASELLQTFAEQLAAPLLEKYSFAKRSDESPNDEELRSIAIELACSASESCKGTPNYANDFSGDYHNAIRSLTGLDESERSKTLYRLIVGSNVTPGDLLQSLHSELSRRQSTSLNPATIPKVLLELSHYVTEPSEMSLLTSVVSQFAPSVASEIDYKVMANRRWIERNIGPLTAALSQIVIPKSMLI